MNELIPRTTKNPNPQGKGCVGVMQDWALVRPQVPRQKSPGDILRDYCLSALVLSARFRFRPVLGMPYYLYCGELDWTLSLIGPQEWGHRMPGEFVANCSLQPDMTWQLEFGELQELSLVPERLQRFVDGFTASIPCEDSLVQGLPFYVEGLPYFQRMLATGLAVSLQHSINETGSTAVAEKLPALTLAKL
ncbi:MAG: hypothetical protein ACJAYC_003869 [Halieaceae bacterium]|jgi:hypothetical protein